MASLPLITPSEAKADDHHVVGEARHEFSAS